MLVIRRRAGETLLIGDQIEIEILDLGPGHVKLGIRAPREVTILRKEVQLTRDQNLASVTRASGESLANLLGSFSSLHPTSSSNSFPPKR